MAAISWKGRLVYIAYDSDRTVKPEVRQAESALAQVLQQLGAVVKVVQLPMGPMGPDGQASKQGLDDFLVQNGAEALQALLGEAVDPEQVKKQPAEETGGLCNYFIEEVPNDDPEDGEEKVKIIAKPLKLILSDCLAKSHGWPKRVGSQLFVVRNYQPGYLENNHALMAYLGCVVPRRSLCPKAHPIDWKSGSDFVTVPQFYAALQQQAQDYQAVECFPHEPQLERHYYAHPPLEDGDGKALFGLLRRFAPATAEDGDLILAFFLSLVTGVP